MKTFYLRNIRELNALVMNGAITSSKMVEILNEAVELGNNYLKETINDLQLTKKLIDLDSDLSDSDIKHIKEKSEKYNYSISYSYLIFMRNKIIIEKLMNETT